MKKFNVFKLIPLLFLIASIAVSCSNDSEIDPPQNLKSDNLFKRIIKSQNGEEESKKGLINISDFTELMQAFRVTNLKVSQSSNNSIDFELYADQIILNGSDYTLDGKKYNIQLANGVYTLHEKDSELTRVKYVIKDDTVILKHENFSIKLKEVDGSEFNEALNEELTMLSIVLREFVLHNLSTSKISSNKLDPGTHYGAGAHLDRGGAEWACNRDYNKILEDSPNCTSPGGVTISCAFDNHLCVCTATFYCI